MNGRSQHSVQRKLLFVFYNSILEVFILLISDLAWQNWSFDSSIDKILSAANKHNITTKLTEYISDQVETFALKIPSLRHVKFTVATWQMQCFDSRKNDYNHQDNNVSWIVCFILPVTNEETSGASLLEFSHSNSSTYLLFQQLLSPNDNTIANFLFRLVRVDEPTTAIKSTPRLHLIKQRLLSLITVSTGYELFVARSTS